MKVTAYSAAGSLPASAKAGDIGIITSTAIGTVYATADAVSSPAAGDIRVLTGAASRAPITLKGNIMVYPRAIYQYSGSAWVIKESYVYSGSAWVEVTIAIYDYGSELLSAMTARSFGGNRYSSVVYTEGSGNVYVYRTDSGDWGYRCWSSDIAIDLTGISTIRLTYTKTSSDFAMTLYISSINTSYLATASASAGTGTVATKSLDVSAYSGLYYIGLYCGAWNECGGNGYIFKLELIP